MRRKLPNWIDGYVEFIEETEAPELFRRWCAMGAISAVLGRKCFMITNESIGPFYPNLYIILVGPPACGKGLAMGLAKDFAERVGVPIVPKSIDRRTMQAFLLKWTESLVLKTGKILVHSSVAQFPEEIMIFFQHGDDVVKFDWLNCWYDGKGVEHQTRERDLEKPENVYLTILGAATPIHIRDSISEMAKGGGFISRCLFVYAEKPHKKVAIHRLTPAEKALKISLGDDIELIHDLEGEFDMDKDYQDKLWWWVRNMEDKVDFGVDALESYVARRRLHLCKLSMVISAAKGGSMILTADDFDEALKFLEATELDMPLIFQGTTKLAKRQLQQQVVSFVHAKGKVSEANLNHYFIGSADLTDLQHVCDALVRGCLLVKKLDGTRFIYLLSKDAKEQID